MTVLKYKEYVNENLNEGISPDVKNVIKSLKLGKNVFGRHVHPRLSGKEFQVLSVSPSGARAMVLWAGEKKPSDMVTMNIDPNKIRIEESVNEANYSAKKEEESLFKLWDKIVGDDREGIYTLDPPGLNFRKSDSSQFVLDLDPPVKMDKWIKEVEKLADKNGWNYSLEVSNPRSKFVTIKDK